MLLRRVVLCVDVLDGRVAKGVNFRSMRDIGDPAELARSYERDGADEIVLLDISATRERRMTMLDIVRRTAESVFIPLTVGGGIGSIETVGSALRAGADKVAINSAAVARPEILTEAALRFGSQCVVASIDARREGRAWMVYVSGGREPTGLDAIEWASKCARLGAGEILLTSIDRDGTRNGYDCDLTLAVSSSVGVPVVASGGAGSPSHVRDVFLDAGADAALVASIVHDGLTTVSEIKRMLIDSGVAVRLVA